MGRDSLAPNVYGPLKSALGTSQAGRKDLLFVFFAQDIHRRRIVLRLSQCPGSAIPLAAFQVSTDGRFWVSAGGGSKDESMQRRIDPSKSDSVRRQPHLPTGLRPKE